MDQVLTNNNCIRGKTDAVRKQTVHIYVYSVIAS